MPISRLRPVGLALATKTVRPKIQTTQLVPIVEEQETKSSAVIQELKKTTKKAVTKKTVTKKKAVKKTTKTKEEVKTPVVDENSFPWKIQRMILEKGLRRGPISIYYYDIWFDHYLKRPYVCFKDYVSLQYDDYNIDGVYQIMYDVCLLGVYAKMLIFEYSCDKFKSSNDRETKVIKRWNDEHDFEPITLCYRAFTSPRRKDLYDTYIYEKPRKVYLLDLKIQHDNNDNFKNNYKELKPLRVNDQQLKKWSTIPDDAGYELSLSDLSVELSIDNLNEN